MTESTTLPDRLPIEPLTRPVNASVCVPGSKSITNRALVLAALAQAPEGCRLSGALQSEDTEVMLESLRRLGFRVSADWSASEVFLITPAEDFYLTRIPVRQAELFVANSGTSMRFLAAMVSLGHGRFRLDGIARMRERPIEDLLTALRQLGVSARSELGNGCPPVVVESEGLPGGQVRIRGDVSSQFLSALLMAAPYAQNDVTVSVDGTLVSEPYVAMTERMMAWWGLRVEHHFPDVYRIPGNQRPHEVERYDIEPDASAASYFFAAAAITGGRVTVLDLPENSLQGDVAFVDVLEGMGCRVERCSAGITVHGRPLHGIDVDMNAISDTVMTLAAVACFADGPTTIRNVAHIRHKETDRLAALATELRRVGARVDEFADGLTITPAPLHGAEIETYNDHRMAMSMALIGLHVPGIVIKNPGCVAKTYPHFFTDLERLRGTS
ncbi:MAG: 3-phosphoshikimate 1-carboxyvinyltransferase [Planctomycetes bacterium]|nr:3-phosphoshikimate 1-carboxyvinyltransferase [Planctomycetota bacterium]